MQASYLFQEVKDKEKAVPDTAAVRMWNATHSAIYETRKRRRPALPISLLT